MHYGVLGMKWGVRRYQNKDGSLTNKGKKYGKDITMGYLQDLGYNKQIAEQFTKRIINSNRKIIF